MASAETGGSLMPRSTLESIGELRLADMAAGPKSCLFPVSRTIFGTLGDRGLHAQSVVLQQKLASPVWDNGVIHSTNGRSQTMLQTKWADKAGTTDYVV